MFFYKVSGTNEIVGSFIITYNTNNSKHSYISIKILFSMGVSEDCCLVTLVWCVVAPLTLHTIRQCEGEESVRVRRV